MKRMSEVFELPISGVKLERAILEAAFCTEQDYAAHAINHIDALADALDVLLKELDLTYVQNASLSDAIESADMALVAYRGDK